MRKERSMRSRRIIFSSWLIGMVLIFTAIFVAPVTLKAYDAAHPLVVECRIIAATAGDGSSRSVRGIGASFNQVRLDSSDCGVLFIRRGVSANNASQIAAEFQDGRRYELQFGAASYRFRDSLRTLHQAVEVQRLD
ncbi:hypothetical protein [Curtobacterium sp. HSID17257]|uniref:hypothetical protein n=1 Tax=Curtobacterium sp. HSID17257 TaxID=2419510 RepID=UPI000F89A717|nr:hypothetical protein [Curtobacterium sp. HSID17257]